MLILSASAVGFFIHAITHVIFRAQVSLSAKGMRSSPRSWKSSCSAVCWGHLHCRAGPALSSGLVWAGAFTSAIWSEPDLSQKFHVIITANTSSVCYTSRLELCVFQPQDDEQITLSHSKPYYTAKPSVACFHPETAKCKHTILCSEIFASVNGHSIYLSITRETDRDGQR